MERKENTKLGRTLDTILQNYLFASVFSPVFRYALLGLRRRTPQFESGMFITSLDVDVGDEKVGVINQGRCDREVSALVSERFVGRVEQRNLPLLLNLFEDFEIPITFAFRGQLLDIDMSLPKLVMGSSIGHEIGSHGYYHTAFTNLSREAADEELKITSMAMKRVGVAPKSFVFPRNRVAHLDLLKKHGYVCYRGEGGLIRDDTYIRADHDSIYDVHPSLWIGWIHDPFIVKKTVNICARRRLPFHVWFHPRDIGSAKREAERRIRTMLSPLLRYAKGKERGGTLTFETMLSATIKAKALVRG